MKERLQKLLFCLSLVSQQKNLIQKQWIISNHRIVHLNNYVKTTNDRTYRNFNRNLTRKRYYQRVQCKISSNIFMCWANYHCLQVKCKVKSLQILSRNLII